MQGDFLVSIGGCDVHDQVLDIKNKAKIKINAHMEMLGMLQMSKILIIIIIRTIVTTSST